MSDIEHRLGLCLLDYPGHKSDTYPMVDIAREADSEIAKLRTELADVRQQRETLKAECAALSAEVHQQGKLLDRAQDGWRKAMVEAKELHAEVERRGLLLRKALGYIGRATMSYEEGSQKMARANRLMDEIESLDSAPDQSQRGTSDG